MHKEHKKWRLKPYSAVIIGLVCLSLGLGLGYVMFKTPEVPAVSVKQTVDNKTLRQIYKILKDQFKDTTNSSKSLSDRMIAGLVKGLGDPHTAYMTKEEYMQFDSSLAGSYVGIGISYLVVNQGALITNCFENSNAYKAGIRTGDILTHVDGVSLAHKNADAMNTMIRGDEGSFSNFTYLSQGKAINKHIKRKATQSDVFYKEVTVKKKKAGVITISAFSDATGKLVAKALKQMQNDHVDTLIMDVRNNGGGYIDAAEDCLALFNKAGTVLYSLKDRQGKVTSVKDTTDTAYHFAHHYILVNNHSASASEILTQSLKELNGFQVIGTPTYGKSTVQVEVPLSNNGVLKYTYASWMSAKGKIISKKGIQPNLYVKGADLDPMELNAPKKTYTQNDLNAYIASMETILKGLGYKVDRTDGYFSPAVKKALTSYQKKQKLSGKGKYNKKTYYYLLSDYLKALKSGRYDPELKKALGGVS